MRRPSAAGTATAVTAALMLVLAQAALVAAAEPGSSPATGGDPRSPGEGPGLVGDPVMAIGLVLAVGVAALLLTLAYVRLTDRPRGSP